VILKARTFCNSFKNLNILPVACMYVSEMVCYIKINTSPHDIATQKTNIDINTEICNHKTCQRLDHCVHFCRTYIFKECVVNTGIKLCNELSNQMRKLEIMPHFKRELRSFLLQHTFYSVNL
jgi:hypothetical protein